MTDWDTILDVLEVHDPDAIPLIWGPDGVYMACGAPLSSRHWRDPQRRGTGDD